MPPSARPSEYAARTWPTAPTSSTGGRRSACRGQPASCMALAFKRAGQDWIGYDQAQSRSTGREWTRFVERSTPRQLELFGFPPPGHPIWTEALLAETALRYPKLDLSPWRDGLVS